ncbi:hypothetical protein J6590_008566 [Homalodisca vitripennis]|nr:hypothetical protein J6590_008566 [Homalodisca vitripennis]
MKTQLNINSNPILVLIKKVTLKILKISFNDKNKLVLLYLQIRKICALIQVVGPRLKRQNHTLDEWTTSNNIIRRVDHRIGLFGQQMRVNNLNGVFKGEGYGGYSPPLKSVASNIYATGQPAIGRVLCHAAARCTEHGWLNGLCATSYAVAITHSQCGLLYCTVSESRLAVCLPRVFSGALRVDKLFTATTRMLRQLGTRESACFNTVGNNPFTMWAVVLYSHESRLAVCLPRVFSGALRVDKLFTATTRMLRQLGTRESACFNTGGNNHTRDGTIGI